MKFTAIQGVVLSLGIGAVVGLSAYSLSTAGELKVTSKELHETNKVLKETVDKVDAQGKTIKNLKDENEQFKIKSSKDVKEIKKLNDLIKEQESDLDTQSKSIKSKDSEIAELKKSIASRRAATAHQKNVEIAKAKETPRQEQVKVVAKETPKEKPEPQVKQVASTKQETPSSPTPSSTPSTASSFEATAYGNQDPSSAGGGVITATGTHVANGRTIAVDPNHIPLGSRVKITVPSMPQYNGVYIAEDTGGAIKGKRIDIYVSDRGSATNFGRRTVYAEVL